MNLKEVRINRGIKLKNAAAHLGVSIPTYSTWESNQENMRLKDIRRACEFLCIDIKDVIEL